MRYHIELVVMRPKNEVEVYGHFGDVEKLPYLVLTALVAQR